MIKFLFLFSITVAFLSGFEIQKDDRIVLEPMETATILEPMETATILKPFANKVLQPYNPELEKKILAIKQEKQKKQKIKQEMVKKQFAKKELLKVTPVKKEQIEVDSDSVKFFDTLNKTDAKPVNIE